MKGQIQDQYLYSINIHMILVEKIWGQCHLKNILKSCVNVTMLFNNTLPMDLYILFEIIKLLIKKGDLNLVHNQNTYLHFNHISRKESWINYTMKG